MNYILNLLEAVVVIGGSENPTAIFFSAKDLPLPAICVSVFGVIFIAYVYIAKAIRSKKAASAPAIEAAPAAPAVSATPMVAAVPTQSGIELVGIDEKTAAVVMAIVSDKTGIPLNRLDFKSIKLMEDK